MPVVSRRSSRVHQHYEWAIKAYVAAGGTKNVGDVGKLEKVFAKLEEKYKPSSVHYIWKVCKAHIEGWPKSVKLAWTKASVSRPVMSDEKVKTLIMSTRRLDNENPLKTYLLLSTIYGLRCCELASARVEDINTEQGTFFARTAKGGVQREHLVPADIMDHLDGAKITPVNEKVVHRSLQVIEALAGVEHQRDYGWHSIRRAINTALGRSPELNPLVAKKFLRWKDAGMSERYTVLDYTVDREVFDVHPFIGYWRTK